MILQPLACFPPSKKHNNAILDALDVENRPEWLPGKVTWCNVAAETAIRALGAHIPLGLLANTQQEWLNSIDGAAQGWECVSASDAIANSEGGLVTVATLHELPHGHIALLRGRDAQGRLSIWQAGRVCYREAPIAMGFGYQKLPEVKFFTAFP